MAAPPRFIESIYNDFPDDETTKEIFIQAEGLSFDGIGDRHVVIWWSNAFLPNTNPEEPVTQLIQLTGQAGNYSYYYPVAKACSPESLLINFQASLGTFSRQQRDQIIALSKEIAFNKKSTVNGCRVWTRDLLEAMVTAGLMSAEHFQTIDSTIPLVARKAES